MPSAEAGRSGRASHQGRIRLRDTLTPVVEATGFDLEDVTVSQAGRRSLIRIIIDADGGVDLDGVALASRAISDALDADDDLFEGPYVLEVSSPGAQRPLTEQRHWRRATGRLVRVDVDGASSTVRVRGADDDGVLVDADDSPEGREHLAWARLGTGVVELEFTRHDGDEDVAVSNEDGEE